jgi:addiction module RelE/StbE family toxin
MKIVFDPEFIKKLKKADVRIRKSVKERILIFSKDPHNPQLDNHPLRDNYEGYRSIDITADWRAIYEQIQKEKEIIAYFVTLGTHKQLYGKDSQKSI